VCRWHIPEHAGCASELGAFGGDVGMRMRFVLREMTKSEPYASAKGQFNLIDDRICQRAMRASMTGFPLRSESLRFWSGVTRSVKFGARVPAARIEDIFCLACERSPDLSNCTRPRR
jgi:hypothetical protein